MNIAIVHYHLKTGGVTTVIRQQVAALESCCRVLVMTGARPDGDFPAEVVQVPALAYDTRRNDTDGPDEITRAVDSALKDRFPGGCDIVHIHNPTLAKNRHLLPVIDQLSKMGHRLFLQIHDLAEDGRIDVYPKSPYPADCHYGVINTRDYQVLTESGLKPEGLHFLPNTVSPMPCSPPDPARGSHVLYPVRAIRRKNIGEAILLSAFFPDGLPLCITLPPDSPADQSSYRRWRRTVNDVGANVVFETGLSNDFKSIMSRSLAVITTSVSEGFGFAFLEPWTAGKYLIGRKLPGIVSDMVRRGVDLTHLYARLQTPMDWIDRRNLSSRWASAIRRVIEVTGNRSAAERLKANLGALLAQDTMDFGLLHETLQTSVVTRLFTDSTAAEDLQRCNPFLKTLLSSPVSEKIRRNREIVLKAYCPEAYRDTLLKIYRHIVSTPVSHSIDRNRLLASFLTVDNFSLLKWQEDDS